MKNTILFLTLLSSVSMAYSSDSSGWVSGKQYACSRDLLDRTITYNEAQQSGDISKIRKTARDLYDTFFEQCSGGLSAQGRNARSLVSDNEYDIIEQCQLFPKASDPHKCAHHLARIAAATKLRYPTLLAQEAEQAMKKIVKINLQKQE